jgi:hypothetical protein
MAQTSQSQFWFVLCLTVAILVLAWPPDRGDSLLVKAIHWIVDPAGALPALPPPLPPGLCDNGDALAEHDAIEAQYYRLYNSGEFTRWRMRVKNASDPFGIDSTTARQLLVAAIAVLWLYRLRKNS